MVMFHNFRAESFSEAVRNTNKTIEVACPLINGQLGDLPSEVILERTSGEQPFLSLLFLKFMN